MAHRESCPFCRIVHDDPERQIKRRIGGCVVIEPLNPVTEGHLLVIPTVHVKDALQLPLVSGQAMSAAASVARGGGACNLITSVGPAATQTVEHLHIHVVPRRDGDKLKLPWSP